MKLATFAAGTDAPSVGAVDTNGGRILGLEKAAGILGDPVKSHMATMHALIEAGPAALDAARKIGETWPEEASHALKAVRLLAPIPEPRRMRDCLVFEGHLVNAMKQWEKLTGTKPAPISPVWYERPSYYKCNTTSVVGPEAEVTWPFYSDMMDFELELACVIGRSGKDLTPAAAADVIFGYTIFNDFSARDLQLIERPLGMGPMKSKDFDTGNVLGPWIVTADEIGDPYDLNMEARVNGERWGGGNSGQMHHKFPDIIAFMTRAETIHAGEIVASGTVPTGCGLEQGRFLSPGDLVELEIDRIGALRNRIVRPEKPQ
jgi:2-keto-4-pentenoate hydratase/2-oxohepta-3-ene-1,7-dioic acid hydratase in catechol pathway